MRCWRETRRHFILWQDCVWINIVQHQTIHVFYCFIIQIQYDFLCEWHYSGEQYVRPFSIYISVKYVLWSLIVLFWWVLNIFIYIKILHEHGQYYLSLRVVSEGKHLRGGHALVGSFFYYYLLYSTSMPNYYTSSFTIVNICFFVFCLLAFQ